MRSEGFETQKFQEGDNSDGSQFYSLLVNRAVR